MKDGRVAAKEDRKGDPIRIRWEKERHRSETKKQKRVDPVEGKGMLLYRRYLSSPAVTAEAR